MMSECPMKRSGRANHPEVHTWRIRDHPEGYEAYCIVDGCKAYSSPEDINGMIDSIEEENEALGWMLHEHVMMLGDAEKKIRKQRRQIKALKQECQDVIDRNQELHNILVPNLCLVAFTMDTMEDLAKASEVLVQAVTDYDGWLVTKQVVYDAVQGCKAVLERVRGKQ